MSAKTRRSVDFVHVKVAGKIALSKAFAQGRRTTLYPFLEMLTVGKQGVDGEREREREREREST
jgi:hypothetical protein